MTTTGPTAAGAAYRGSTAVLTTKHGKHDSVAPPLSELLGWTVEVADLDTDVLGTFTGEVPRTRPPLDTAVAKARLGMDATGRPLGLATEGSFTAHPGAPWITVHTEIVVLVDDTRPDADGHPLVVVERRATLDSNAIRHTVTTEDQLTQVLQVIGFPAAGVIIRADGTRDDGGTGDEVVVKGLCDHQELQATLDHLRRRPDTQLIIEADLRAHLNPLRRQVIARAAHGLALRLASPCPACFLPGFGHLHSEPGLPCADCGTPTTETAATVLGCARCPQREHRPVSGTAAAPAYCPLCNP